MDTRGYHSADNRSKLSSGKRGDYSENSRGKCRAENTVYRNTAYTVEQNRAQIPEDTKQNSAGNRG